MCTHLCDSINGSHKFLLCSCKKGWVSHRLWHRNPPRYANWICKSDMLIRKHRHQMCSNSKSLLGFSTRQVLQDGLKKGVEKVALAPKEASRRSWRSIEKVHFSFIFMVVWMRMTPIKSDISILSHQGAALFERIMRSPLVGKSVSKWLRLFFCTFSYCYT